VNSRTISTAMPADPAIPTAENESVMNTFSMSRWAIMLPIVARRSPAMTTPPAKVSATMVVPCGTSRPGVRGAAVCPRRSIPSGIRPGSRCGAVAAR
jgi:hypothetical protein